MAHSLKIFILFSLLIAYSTNTIAQYIAPFAIIKDKDGVVNVREGKNPNSKIIDKLVKNQVFEDLAFMNEESESEWHVITYGKYSLSKNTFNKTTKEQGGYIHKSRILYLSQLPQLKKSIINDSITEFKNDSVKIIIKIGSFISQKYRNHKLDTYGDGYLLSIDGERSWGTDGISLETLVEIRKIIIYSNGKQHTFPVKAINNIFSPWQKNMIVALSDDNTMFIVMSNGDAGNAYNVVWTIKNNIVVSEFINRDF